MSAEKPPFGIGVGEAFAAGVRGYGKNLVPLSSAGIATLATFMAFRIPAQSAIDSGQLARSLILDLVGLILASVVAHPWYSYALDADRGRPIDLRKPFTRPSGFWMQAVASFWFWAGFLFGLRYLWGIPSIIVLLFYAFYGFVIADREAKTGMRALGVSAYLGEKRRIGMFAIASLLLILNMFGAIAVGFGVNTFTLVLTFIGLTITTNVSLVVGARIYRVFRSETI